MIALYSKKACDIPYLSAFLADEIKYRPSLPDAAISAVAGWGIRNSSKKPRQLSKKYNLPYLAIEDGFIRSFGLGCVGTPPLSLVVDDVGIYYDASRPSLLENMLNSREPIPKELLHSADQALNLVLEHSLCKYNQTAIVSDSFFRTLTQKILIVDQTAGDASIEYGLASEDSFQRMFDAALEENPSATFYLKVHPDVLSGKKRGLLSRYYHHPKVRVIMDDCNPHSIMRYIDTVYVVTSQLGFEALLHGKHVVCFGVPFYSGWGVTDDRTPCPRRSVQRTVSEIFAIAYCQYARYLNPSTGKAGTVLDVVNHLIAQRAWDRENSRDYVCFGVQPWKRSFIRPFLQSQRNKVLFANNAFHAKRICKNLSPQVLTWGYRGAKEAREFACRGNNQIWKIEDGFIRSFGLGSDIIAPYSLAIDRGGIYFDPASDSDLQRILATFPFHDDIRARAARIRKLIVENNITKYNVDMLEPIAIEKKSAQTVIFVPGQVETDASISYGARHIMTNEALLRTVRTTAPDAFIIYKPHPDLVARNRPGTPLAGNLAELCDLVETRRSVLSCIAVADEVHTITSLSGFDALLREKSVVVYGQPFYAGWGLTKDQFAFPQRSRTLTLDELVAGSLILYPRYYDNRLRIFVDCETIIERIVESRGFEGSRNRQEGRPWGLFFRQLVRFGKIIRGTATR